MNDKTFRAEKVETEFQSLLYKTEDANRVCRVLASNTRLKILCFVANGEKTVNQIRIFTKERQSTVSQQLARLRNYGVVGSRREGKTVYYKLRCSHTRSVLECLQGVAELGSRAPSYGGD